MQSRFSDVGTLAFLKADHQPEIWLSHRRRLLLVWIYLRDADQCCGATQMSPVCSRAMAPSLVTAGERLIRGLSVLCQYSAIDLPDMH